MSNEIRATGNLQITKDGFTITGNNTQTISMTGSQYIGNIQSIGTSYEQIVIGDLSDVRYLYIFNQSSASIDVSQYNNTTSASFARLQADDVLMLPPSSSITAYYVKATEANADIQVVAVEQ
jgi:hypothetical protein